MLWPKLYSWSATRGPYSKVILTQNANDQDRALREEWVVSILPLLNRDIDIEDVKWDQISKFTDIVSKIKMVKSPVFTSKFCHFLAPRIFPVTDNAAMGNPFKTYEDYFKNAKNEWTKTDQKTRDNLEATFKRSINTTLDNNFPIKCKLIEICLIGRNQK